MARRKEHLQVGGFAGAAAAAVFARKQPGPALVAEAVGGYFAGQLGGRLPDLIEPPTSPRHRDFAHSVTAAGLIVSGSLARLDAWQEHWRDSAQVFRTQRGGTVDSLGDLLLLLAETVCHVMAGAGPGLAAGYLSHLVLDNRTSRLPLI